jgi:hypothetical protein
VRYCGRNGFIPTYFSKLDSIRKQAQLFAAQVAAAPQVQVVTLPAVTPTRTS